MSGNKITTRTIPFQTDTRKNINKPNSGIRFRGKEHSQKGAWNLGKTVVMMDGREEGGGLSFVGFLLTLSLHLLDLVKISRN